jgi:hypothetical protein
LSSKVKDREGRVPKLPVRGISKAEEFIAGSGFDLAESDLKIVMSVEEFISTREGAERGEGKLDDDCALELQWEGQEKETGGRQWASGGAECRLGALGGRLEPAILPGGSERKSELSPRCNGVSECSTGTVH